MQGLYLWVRLDGKPVVTQVALASERVYRRRVVVSYLLLLRIVAYTHTNVVVATITV